MCWRVNQLKHTLVDIFPYGLSGSFRRLRCNSCFKMSAVLVAFEPFFETYNLEIDAYVRRGGGYIHKMFW